MGVPYIGLDQGPKLPKKSWLGIEKGQERVHRDLVMSSASESGQRMAGLDQGDHSQHHRGNSQAALGSGLGLLQ